ncbi:MAG TPA: Maf family protein [Ktedonobacterales bacterium]|nr:Maf family protein [Ktedonobacterales bacterium]
MPRPPLFLASASPRRRQILTEAGIPFTLHVTSVDEDTLTHEYTGPLDRLGEYLARQKARAACDSLAHVGLSGTVLASDTTVLIDGQSLAKPRDHREASAMLRTLRGREHVVATGIALAGPTPEHMISATAATRVRMRDFNDAELTAYVATGDPLDKAGAYSIQHPNFSPVAAITGCHLGVIGLPVCLVSALVNGTPLPPDALTCDRTCPWSARCTPPFPGPDGITETSTDATHHP